MTLRLIVNLCVAMALALAAPLAAAQANASTKTASDKSGAGPAKPGAAKSAGGPGKAAAKGPSKPFPPMPVRAAAAKTAPAVDTASAVGTLRADESVMIRPEIVGRIDRIAFAEGQRVKKGETLVQLDDAEFRAMLASSVAQAQLDRQRLERAEDLFRKNFISQQALDESRSNRLRSAAKQREEEAKLAKTVIRAPFDGIAGLRQVSEGAYVAAGTDIARLDKIDTLKLDFRLPETMLAGLGAGQAVSVSVDAWPGAAFKGEVYAIEPTVDEATRTVLARARVDNAALRLRPGMFARVRAELGRRAQAVWIPEDAVVPQGGESFVYRVVGGKVERVSVRLGLRKVGEVEVREGIAAGDLVVTEGTQKLRPGAPVRVMGADAPASPAASPATKAGTRG